MKTLSHKIFGSLNEVAEELWERPEELFMFGEKNHIALTVSIPEDDGVSQSQLGVFAYYRDNCPGISSLVEQSLFRYYQSVCGKYRDQMGITDPKDPNVPLISSVKELALLVTPEAVYFPDIYDEPTFGFLFKCTWEPEHGVAVVVENGEVKEVGYQDIIL